MSTHDANRSSYNSALSEVTIGHEYLAHFVPQNETEFLQLGLTNLTISQFLAVYNTRYIPDHGDVFITYGAVALSLTLPNVSDSPLSLENSLIGVGNGRSIVPWVPISLALLGMPYVPDVALPSTVNVNFTNTTFPFSVAAAVDDVRYLEATNWVNLYDGDGLGSSTANQGVPAIHITPPIRSVSLRDGSKVQVILSYMLVVIACNTLKMVVMWTLWRNAHVEYCTTVGDAVQSFLRWPDQSTIGLCAKSRDSLVKILATEHERRTAHMTILYQK